MCSTDTERMNRGAVEGRNRAPLALSAGAIAIAAGLVLGSTPGARAAARRVKAPGAVVRCVGVVGGGVVVQIEPARARVSVGVRSGARGPLRRAKTDVAGRAQVIGTFGPSVFATASAATPGPYTVGPCAVSVSAVGPNRFQPVSGAAKARTAVTLGFGVGELVIPAGALNNGVGVRVVRGPKSIVPGDAAAAPALSGPISIETDGGIVPAVPFPLAMVAPLPPGEAGPSVRVYYQAAGATEPQPLAAIQRDLIVAFRVPGPGTIEAVLAPTLTLPPDHPLITGKNTDSSLPPVAGAPTATAAPAATVAGSAAGKPVIDPTETTVPIAVCLTTDAELSAAVGRQMHFTYFTPPVCGAKERNGKALAFFTIGNSPGGLPEFCNSSPETCTHGGNGLAIIVQQFAWGFIEIDWQPGDNKPTAAAVEPLRALAVTMGARHG